MIGNMYLRLKPQHRDTLNKVAIANASYDYLISQLENNNSILDLGVGVMIGLMGLVEKDSKKWTMKFFWSLFEEPVPDDDRIDWVGYDVDHLNY